MDTAIERLVLSLFGKTSLESCSEEEVQALATQYPYCSTFQVLLTYRTGKDNASYGEILQKTGIHFSNPFLADYILRKQGGLIHPGEGEPGEEAVPEEKTGLPAPENIHNDEEVIENIPVREKETIPQAAVVPEAEMPVELLPEDGLEELLMDEEQPEDDEEPLMEDEQQEYNLEETIIPEEENLKIRSILEKEIEASDKEKELVIDPQFTIDYFASQGIIDKSGAYPSDRFSLQLKSFTEWLKILKNASPEEISRTISHDSEERVVTMAGKSVEEKEIITETMAEVWLKQGNKEKAAAIYQKLSLLNPPKSAYFASLIEKIKSS